MKPITFAGFATVTAIIILWAAFSIASRYETSAVAEGRPLLFPGLDKRINEVGEVSTRNKTETLTIKRGPKGWSIVERQNFAVPNDKVRDVVIGLSQLRQGEAKTKKKKFHKRLQVDDVTLKDAQSLLVRVMDTSGKELVKLLVGRRNREAFSISGVGRYIRFPGDDQAWLAYGALEVPDTAKKWTKPVILDIVNKRIQRVHVVQPDGKAMTAVRVKPDKSDFRVENLPAGKEIEFQTDVDNMADGLDGLDFEDVRATGKLKFPPGKITRSEYRTKDGLIVEVVLWEKESNDFWGRFKARVADGVTDAKVLEAAKKEAAEINKRLGPWVYQLPAYKYRYMSRKLKDVLKKPEEKKK